MNEQTKERVILWDIDGTLIDRSLEKLFLEFLLAQNVISIPKITLNALRLILKLPFPQLYQYKLYYLAGLSEALVNEQIHLCWKQSIKQNLRPGIVELIGKLHKRNTQQVLLSGTLTPLAVPLKEYLNCKELIAGNPKIQSGTYTGSLTGPHPRGPEKVTQAERWLVGNNLNWTQVIAVADNKDDSFLFERAGVAIAMTPDSELRAYAKSNSISIAETVSELADILLK